MHSEYVKEVLTLQAALLEAGVGMLAFPLCENVDEVLGETALDLERSEEDKYLVHSSSRRHKGSPGDSARKSKGQKDKQKTSRTTKAGLSAKEWDDIWAPEEEESKETYSKPELFFGRTAKDKFWSMYK
jgi:hypothetical protein